MSDIIKLDPKGKKELLTKGECIRLLVSILKQSPDQNFALPSKRVMVYENYGYSTFVFVDERNVLTKATDEEVFKVILEYIENQLIPSAVFYASFVNFSISGIHDSVTMAKALCPRVTDVKPVAFANDPSYAWHKLDFDLDDKSTIQNTAAYNFISRCSDPDAVLQFIGSLFVDSRREQYLWLYGEGGEGKSTFVSFIDKLMGKSSRGAVVPNLNDRFWTASLIGYRLVCFNDTNNYGFPATGLFKSLTGDDAIQIEEKFGGIRNVYLNAKFIFTSNERPNLSSERADRRRAIYVEVSELKTQDQDHSIHERLWEDRQAIVSAAVLHYQTYSKHGSITANTEALDEIIVDNETIYSSVFEKCFILESDAKISSSRVQDILRKEYTSNTDIRNFYAWLRRTHNKKSKLIKEHGAVTRMYLGMRENRAYGVWSNTSSHEVT